MLFSILTPSLPIRLDQLGRLQEEIGRQIGDQAVEHLAFIDNKRRSIGDKREALLQISRGEYVAFVDDDDWIAPNYVEKILESVRSAPDVITFRQMAFVNEDQGEVDFDLRHPHNGRFVPGGLRYESPGMSVHGERGLPRRRISPR